jgi:hypothetical protein
MREREEDIYLESLFSFNFRHDEENPLVMGLVMYEPEGLPPRPCFKVEYESDQTVDYINYDSVRIGQWQFVTSNIPTNRLRRV